MNEQILKEYIEKYKQDFARVNKEEIYKWYIVAEFQKHWNIKAENFYEMLNRAIPNEVMTPFGKVDNNLLTSGNFYARNMILSFAEKEPETVRLMFTDLYNEDKPLDKRIESFILKSNELLAKEENAKKHYQDLRSISVYLFFRYPEKYYIYKYTICNICIEVLSYGKKLKKGDNNNIKYTIDLYDKMRDVIRRDKELITLSQSRLDKNCYQDENFNLLTIDIGYFIESLNKQLMIKETDSEKSNKVDECWYVGAIIDGNDMLETFIENGIWQNGYDDKYKDKVLSMKKGDRIAIKSAYTQKNNLPFDIKGQSAAVMDIKAIGTILEKSADGKTVKVHWDKVWKNPKKWFFLQYRITVSKVNRREDDWIFGALLDFTFNDTEQDYNRFLEHPYWSDKYNLDIEEAEVEESEDNEKIAKYTRENFLKDVYISAELYNSLCSVLKRKKNIILTGAPGVGKTYLAKRLVYSIISKTDDKVIRTVQFHQNYTYEDFIIGYRPTENGFVLKTGIFYDFCKLATENKDKDYFFLIDEINRGNISKIFGELLMLIENEYRNTTITLAYNGEDFAVPDNVYIIGMMNTADKSLAMIDYALRRRFSFFNIKPAFNSEQFKQYQKNLSNTHFDSLIVQLKSLNETIKTDISLGEGFCIGHSYVCNQDFCTDEWLKNIIEYELLPIIKDYWFDEPEKVQQWELIFRGIFND